MNMIKIFLVVNKRYTIQQKPVPLSNPHFRTQKHDKRGETQRRQQNWVPHEKLLISQNYQKVSEKFLHSLQTYGFPQQKIVSTCVGMRGHGSYQQSACLVVIKKLCWPKLTIEENESEQTNESLNETWNWSDWQNVAPSKELLLYLT